MYHRFVVDLPEPAFERLAEMARSQRRGVRDQAAVLLETALTAGQHRSGVASKHHQRGSGQLFALRPGPEAA